MARSQKKQPGPAASPVERLKHVADILGIELIDLGVEAEEVTAAELASILSGLKEVNANYVFTGTGVALLTTIKSKKLKDYTGINARIRRLRLELDLTQEEFGEKLGYRRSTIASIEQNKQTISFAALRKIVQLYDVTYEYIIDGVRSPNGDYSKLKEQLEECRSNNKALRMLIQ